MAKRRFLYLVPIVFLLIAAVAGWFATDYIGNKSRQEMVAESLADTLALTIHAFSTFTHFERAVKALAGSPWIAPLLLSKEAQDIEHVNSVLDRYNLALNASLTYLMDTDGMTVASSNRDDPDSNVGKSYRFRPYFQGAVKGQPARYFALGITTGKRGFYASRPVQDSTGKVLGVVTMKKDIDEMEVFFSRHAFSFLVSPDGIIFLSSSPAMVLKSLWPLDKAVQEKLIASRQFGNKPFGNGFFNKEFADGMGVTLEGKDYFVSRKVIDNAGWSIVLLTPADRVGDHKLIGILATILACFSIVFLSGIILVTDRSKEAIRQSEEKHRLLFDSAGDAIFVFDTEGRMLAVNPLACERLGYTHAELMSMTMDQLYSPEEALRFPDLLAGLTEQGHLTHETVRQCKDGSLIPTDVIARRITWDGQPAFISTCHDITDRKQAEEQIRQMAYHDSLTGLPNRKLLYDRLDIALANAQRNKKDVGVAMLDLDKFKDVNDTLGHDVGDLLLKATAERLSAALRKGDTVARFGGDEFLLILPDLKAAEDAIQVAQKIVDSFRKPFLIDTHQMVVTTSIGIAVYPDDGVDESTLLKNADIAMYQAKEAGRDRYQIYNKA
jgi:diguanylate cyclase (GGDEF)-like protein/PAS domain S-box-containing protein